MTELTINQLSELGEHARQAYFDGRVERWETLPPSKQEDWRRVARTVIEHSLDLPEQFFQDFQGLTEEGVKAAAKEGAAEAITEATEMHSTTLIP